MGMSYLAVNDMVRAQHLYKWYDQKSRSYVIDTRKLHRRIKRVLDETDRVIIDTGYVGSLVPRNQNIFAIVVRLDPVTLSRRLRRRGWSRRKLWENVEAELIDVALVETVAWLGKSHVTQIDSTGKSRSALVSEAMKITLGKKKGRFASVDWLQKYDPIELSRKL
jgi:adenylate kinase